MASYESSLNEKEFSESLSRALTIIESGIKTGTDNLELILDKHDLYDLGPMTDVLNRCEIEYRQGKIKKMEALKQMLENYETSSHPEKQKGLKNLLGKCKEMELLRGAHMNAEGWLRLLNFGRYDEATPPTDDELFVEAVKYFAGLKDDSKMPETIYAAHFTDDPDIWIPPCNTYSKNFCSNKEISDLNDRLDHEIHHQKGEKNNIKEGHRKDLVKLKKMSADKFAYTRAEILGMLDLYRSPQDNEAYK